jgi:ATP-dependent 26S proteasome regulatory subunit
VTRVKEDPSDEHKEHTTSANQGPVVQYAKVHPTTQVRLCHDDQEDEITRFQTTAVSPEASSTTSATTVVASFDQIGGLQNEIATVRGMIEKPLHAPELFVQLGLAPPKGILMFGPPGTGKTMIARAVAVSSRATFLSINGSELLSDVVGASETALRNIFQQALERQPTVIFIDEIDALCPKRESSADVDKRMVSTILTLMDGVNDGGNDGGGGGGSGGKFDLC